jgi:hypothetical protein
LLAINRTVGGIASRTDGPGALLPIFGVLLVVAELMRRSDGWRLVGPACMRKFNLADDTLKLARLERASDLAFQADKKPHDSRVRLGRASTIEKCISDRE